MIPPRAAAHLGRECLRLFRSDSRQETYAAAALSAVLLAAVVTYYLKVRKVKRSLSAGGGGV